MKPWSVNAATTVVGAFHVSAQILGICVHISVCLRLPHKSL